MSHYDNKNLKFVFEQNIQETYSVGRKKGEITNLYSSYSK